MRNPKHHYVHVRIEAELHETLKSIAEKNCRSVSAQARLYLDAAVKKELALSEQAK